MNPIAHHHHYHHPYFITTKPLLIFLHPSFSFFPSNQFQPLSSNLPASHYIIFLPPLLLPCPPLFDKPYPISISISVSILISSGCPLHILSGTIPPPQKKRNKKTINLKTSFPYPPCFPITPPEKLLIFLTFYPLRKSSTLLTDTHMKISSPSPNPLEENGRMENESRAGRGRV